MVKIEERALEVLTIKLGFAAFSIYVGKRLFRAHQTGAIVSEPLISCLHEMAKSMAEISC